MMMTTTTTQIRIVIVKKLDNAAWLPHTHHVTRLSWTVEALEDYQTRLKLVLHPRRVFAVGSAVLQTSY